MKNMLIALSTVVIVMASFSSTTMAGQSKPSDAFFKQLDHASFMPNLMKHIMQSKTELGLSQEQVKTLKNFKNANSPQVQKMVESLTEVEKQALQMTLDNYPPPKVAEMANLSLNIRNDIFNAKLKCRSFVKSVLTPEQYKKALTSYK